MEDSIAMRSIFGIAGILIVLGVGYYLYTNQFNKESNRSPKQQIDLVGLRGDLLSLAQAERLYFASNGSYATLEQLQQAGGTNFQGAIYRGYQFTIETDGLKHFQITARPADPARTDWPSLSVDETQQISVLNQNE